MSFINKKTNVFIKSLYLLVIGVLAIIVLVTVIVFATKKARPGSEWRKTDPAPQKMIKQSIESNNKIAAFTSLGDLRILSKSRDSNSKGSIILISPWFSYKEGDTVLFEELSDKNRKIKSIFAEYFINYTIDELHKKGEVQIKQELLHKINEELVLGKINAVYFDKYVFFE